MSDASPSPPAMRISLLLLTLVVAGPALGQSALRPARTSALPAHGRAAATAQPVAAVYSWVDEADGRYVAARPDTYLTREQHEAWAAGDDAPYVRRAQFSAGRWTTVVPVATCDVLKCLHPRALDVATTSGDAPDARPRVIG